MKYIWYCVRPLLLYLVVFAAVSALLNALFSGAPARALQNAGMLYALFYTAIYAAGLLVMLYPARNEIHYYEALPSRIAGMQAERVLYGIIFVSTICLALFLNIVLNITGIVQTDPSMQASANVEALMGLPLCTAVFGILAPLTEECVFRAILCGRLERGFGPVAAALLSSALFAVYHGNLPQMIYAFCMGVVFARSYQLTHRFVLPYMLHACTNILVTVLSFTGVFEMVCTPIYALAFGTVAGIGGFITLRVLRSGRK